MPIFYFNVREGANYARDDEGLECADIQEAKCEAEKAGGELVAEDLFAERPAADRNIEVTDHSGKPVLTVSISASVIVETTIHPSN